MHNPYPFWTLRPPLIGRIVFDINKLNLVSNIMQIKPINSKETVETIKFLAQYEKEKINFTLSKVSNIRKTTNFFFALVVLVLALKIERLDSLEKIISLFLFFILTIILVWVNWDITILSGFSSKSIMKEVYGETKTLKPNSFYNTKINNEEELIWNYTLNGYLSGLKDTENKIQIFLHLRKALVFISLFLIIMVLFA